MTKCVLTVRRTVFHSAEKLYLLGVKSVNTGLEYGTLTRLLNSVINVAASLFNHLLDSCGMDSSVGYELFKSKSCDLTSYGIESGYGYNVGRIVDYKLNTREILNSSDVSSLTSDNSSLHLVAGNLNYGYSDLAYVVCRTSLNSKGKDILCLCICFVLEFFLILSYFERSLVLHFIIKSRNELVLCVLFG